MPSPNGIATLPRQKTGRLNSLQQLIDIQRGLLKSCQLLTADIEKSRDKELRSRLAGGLSALARSWEVLEERKRILKGQPLPGSLRPESTAKDVEKRMKQLRRIKTQALPMPTADEFAEQPAEPAPQVATA